MGWFETIKAPPIPSPMPAADRARILQQYPNNNMSIQQAKAWFTEVIDPILLKSAEQNAPKVSIPLTLLKMNGEVAMNLINRLYDDTYKSIELDENGYGGKGAIVFDMTHEGTVPQLSNPRAGPSGSVLY